MSIYKPLTIKTLEVVGVGHAIRAMRLPMEGRRFKNTDDNLARNLVRKGHAHAKFARGILVYYELWMQLGWMIEWYTYRIGREVLSTSSSMHDELRALSGIALAEEKQSGLSEKVYHQIGYISYPAIRSLYIDRRKHRHPDWQIFCDWVESLPHFGTLILPEHSKNSGEVI